MISIALLFVAGLLNGTLNTLSFHYGSSIFYSFKNQRWWNPNESWKNKWRTDIYGDTDVGVERFFLSSSILVMFTDAWHMLKAFMILCFLFSAVLYSSVLDIVVINDFLTLIINVVILHLAFTLGFTLTWNVLLPKRQGF